ncbi:MAG: diguanylate cyclase [Wenzhouxiangellaceae bacterium]
MKHCWLLLVLVLVLFPALGQAGAEVTGRPAIQRFVPEADVYPRNFAVTQGPAGLVYVGNAEGLLVFDGSRWDHHPTGDQEMIRRLAHDGESRLYYGGFNTFGYFEMPVLPGAEPVNLAETVFGLDKPDFEDIWQIEVLPEGVFFLALNNLYAFDPETGRTRHWHHPGRFGAMARIDGEVIVQYRGEGLRVLRGDEFVPVPGSAALSDQLFDLLPLPGGGLLTTARDGRWRSFRNGQVAEFRMPDGFPESSAITATEVLDDGWLVFGSVSGWLYFFHPGSGAHEAFRIADDWIGDLSRTSSGGLVAQTDLETLYVRWPARWSEFSTDDRLAGNVIRTLEWQDRLLVMSNGGARISSAAEPTRFEPLPWSDFEAWDFLPLGDGTGLFADSYQVMHVDSEGILRQIEGIAYPRRIVASRFDPELFFVGSEDGLFMLRRDGADFSVIASVTEGLALPFSILQPEPGVLLLGTQGTGVRQVQYDLDPASLHAQEAGAGIEDEDADYVELGWIDGRVHAYTQNAAWVWNGEEFARTDLHGLDALRRPGRYLEPVAAPDGSLWAYDFNRLLKRDAEAGWHKVEIDPVFRGAISALDFDRHGRVLLGVSGGLLIHDPEADELPVPAFDVMLRPVIYRSEADEARLLDPSESHEIPDGDYSIKFEYSLPGLHARDRIRYRAQLVGSDPDFTGWESSSQYTYFRLKPGNYQLQVQGRDAAGRVSSIQPFEFRVVPPWYRTSWVLALRWVALALLLGLMIWVWMRARVRRLEAERRRLAGKVRQRTEALVVANRKLRQMAEVDELTGVANRRRFDRYLHEQLVQCTRDRRDIAVALIDLDQFKPYNDRHGHLAGDRVLKNVARCLTEGFGDSRSLVARFGGDEFAAVLPGMDETAARDAAEVARDHCANACGEVELSIGIAVLPAGQESDSLDLLELADRQLYRVKEDGRNGISVARVPDRAG